MSFFFTILVEFYGILEILIPKNYQELYGEIIPVIHANRIKTVHKP